MKKNKWLAATLSFFFAGLGHLYLGQNKKAIIYFIAEIATVGLMYTINETLGALLNVFVGVSAIADSYINAKYTEEKIEIKKEEEKKPVVKVY